MNQIFRYPGGKAKAIKFIKPFWENCPHQEYREPFVGGGSVFIAKENVFVISHKGDTLIDKFPRVMKFEKYKNFTRMAE